MEPSRRSDAFVMKKHREFSPARFWAIVVKEFIQMRRDRLTFAMMIGIPLMQLILFGFAINSDPQAPAGRRAPGRPRPAGPHAAARDPQQQLLRLRPRRSRPKQEARDALARGEVQFVINIPENFTRDLLRGDRPTLLIEADATDPAATGNAVGASRLLLNTRPAERSQGPARLSGRRPTAPSTCASTRSTTRKRSRSTTSCPA